jgi:hypothetical protein
MKTERKKRKEKGTDEAVRFTCTQSLGISILIQNQPKTAGTPSKATMRRKREQTCLLRKGMMSDDDVLWGSKNRGVAGNSKSADKID